MTFGPNGNLFVSDGQISVQEYNGTTGAFVRTFATGGPGGGGVGGLSLPEGLTFGPNGNLFVSNFRLSSVSEYNGTTGAFVTAFVPPPSGGANSSTLVGPIGLTFGPNGNLFVSSGDTNSVQEYNGATGAFVTTFVPRGSGGLAVPWGLTFGANGDLFVSSRDTNSVLEYNGTTGAFVRTFASGSGLIQPLGLVFGPNGNLFVSCSPSGFPSCNGVLEYNGTTGAFVRTFVTSGSGGLNGPNFLTFGPTGAIGGGGGGTTPPPSGVPEPSTWLLLGSGLAGLMLWRKRNSLARRRSVHPSGIVAE